VKGGGGKIIPSTKTCDRNKFYTIKAKVREKKD